jgi:hypothetical protein
MCIF